MHAKSDPASDTVTHKHKQYLNVIMHGAFGYVFDEDFIRAYTPACFGHIYNAGNISKPLRDSNPAFCQGVDYELTGVIAADRPTIEPPPDEHPVLSFSQLTISRKDVDVWRKRYTMIRLPYPARREAGHRETLMHGALYAYVGGIYSGAAKAMASLNTTMKMCPSLHIFVYEIEDGMKCQLAPDNPPCSDIPRPNPIPPPPHNSCDPDTTNFHVFCTRETTMMMPMTSEGHIRQTFASVVDLFGGLELSLNFPNGFHPGVPGSKCNPPLPVGVDRAKDLEPGVMHEPDCPDGGVSMLVGHVNCEYTDLMFVP